jgi:hypothetical protein
MVRGALSVVATTNVSDITMFITSTIKESDRMASSILAAGNKEKILRYQ